jgi:hypothetical protein
LNLQGAQNRDTFPLMRLAPYTPLTAKSRGLATGLKGIYQTLAVMRSMVKQYRTNPQIRQAATTVVFMTPEKDEYSEVTALFDFVRQNIRYVKDIHDVETLSTPDKTLAGRVGDCDDQATLLATMLESVGYPTRFAVAGYQSPHTFEHVYLQVFVHGDWVDCDPTEQSAYFGWFPPDPVCLMFERV